MAERAAAILEAARDLLEREGPDGLAMRPLAERIGAHPPAVYRHFQDKRAIERAVVVEALHELGRVLDDAVARARGDPVGAVCSAYRGWAVEHPHLLRLMYGRAPRGEVPTEDELAAQVHAAAARRGAAGGDDAAALALWGCTHGLVTLELDGQVAPGPELDGAWTFVLDAVRERLRELE